MAAGGRKLRLYEKVEVRSLDDGFHGSWHTGTVVGDEELLRVVEYDHLLRDGSSDKLREEVNVSPAIDGIVDEELKRPYDYRGLIRPSPPSQVKGTWSPHYGDCVDFLYKNAWWEGVVFDHEDGCMRRRIFFPDIGDEMVGSVDDMRLSKDWDEVTEKWKPRGSWVFLRLVNEIEQKLPLVASVQQMWYDLRAKEGFEKLREWTSCKWKLWKELTLQVLADNTKITAQMILTIQNSQSSIKLSEEEFDSLLKPEDLFDSSLAVVVPSEATLRSENGGTFQTDASDKSNSPMPALPVLSRYPDEDSGIGSNNYDESASVTSEEEEDKSPTKKKGFIWKLAVPKLISGAEKNPNAIDACNKFYRLGKKPPPSLFLAASKHLLYLGWKIEFARDRRNPMIRRRYSSPEGYVYMSLLTVCKTFDHDFELLMSPKHRVGPSVSSYEETPSTSGKSQASSELSKSCVPDMISIEPEHCPGAVRDYYLFRTRKELRGGSNVDAKLKVMKAKKHLSAKGWSFGIHMKGKKRELHYVSPTGKVFYSLVSACKWFIDDEAVTPINDIYGNPSTSKSDLPLIAMDSPLVDDGKSENMQLFDNPVIEDFDQSTKGEAYKTKMSRKRKMRDKSHSIEDSLPPKRGRKSHSSMILRGDSNADSSTPLRQSSKRVRDRIASSSQKAPQTILSLLIDNNVILPREKVHYRCRKSGPRMAEGKITREGIKCACCGEIFTLSKFEAHAGGTENRASANIVLEDGRSLLDCQMQLKQRNTNRSLRLERELKPNRNIRRNDYICSVCHYGGELVMCDQCPSSFHIHCLGITDLPDGDWFCLSCCCQICNQSRLNEGNYFLICGQCERRYHTGCVNNKGDRNYYSEGDWFCGDTCQQIFYGLRKTLGKKIPVGNENLTWSLVKNLESGCSKDDACDEDSVEGYSKLNLALSVMHECFQTVKERWTKRDLMEDVILSRWSELNRLNFRGFYTVILEKDDEVISVATVRIYGKTVAEVPLVATRFQYRRLGMCRILMNELEKKLAELGVERLVLPAIPSVLHTWTTSFGFSKMNESERLNFLVYTFLDFQGTVFCQKMLKNSLSTVSTLSAETQRDNAYENDDICFDGKCGVSEVVEGKQVAEEATSTKAVVDNGNAISSAETETAIMVDRPPLQLLLALPAVVPNSDDKSQHKGGELKCYTRRRIPAC